VLKSAIWLVLGSVFVLHRFDEIDCLGNNLGEGGRMIAPLVIQEVQRLLQKGGFSQRKIAKEMGISRGTVNSVAQGKRKADLVKNDRTEWQDEIICPAGEPCRCPKCGRLVQKPCLACQLRDLRKRHKRDVSEKPI
jgi:Helix-turn-helix